MAESSGNVLDSFAVSLGFSPDTSGAAVFEQALLSIKNFMGGLSIAAIGAAGAVGYMVQDAIKQMADVNSFAEVVGLSAAEIFAVGKAAASADVTMEAWEGTVQSLSSMIGQASQGIGRGAKILGQYGIKAKDAEGKTRDIKDVLGDVADKMQGMDQSQRLSMASRLGIDAHAIALLKDGSKSFDEFYESAVAGSALTDADFGLADNVDKGLEKLKGSFGKVLRSIAAVVLPLLDPIINAFLWLTNTITWLVNMALAPMKIMFTLIGDALNWLGRSLLASRKALMAWGPAAAVVTFIGRAFRATIVAATIAVLAYLAALAIQKLVAWGGAMLNAVKNVGSLADAFKAMRAALLSTTGLFSVILAAVALLGLVIQDLWVYFNGGDSVIGRLIARFPWLAKWIDWMKPAVKAIGAAFVWLWDAVSSFDVLAWLSSMGRAIADIYTKYIAPAIAAFVTFATDTWNKFGATFMEVCAQLWAVGSEVFNLIYDIWKTILAAIFGDTDGTFNGLQDIIRDLTPVFQLVFGAALEIIKGTLYVIQKVIDGVKEALKWFGILDERNEKPSVRRKLSPLNGVDGGTLQTISGNLDSIATDTGPGAAQSPTTRAEAAANVTTTTQVFKVEKMEVVTPDPAKSADAISKAQKNVVRNAQNPAKI